MQLQTQIERQMSYASRYSNKRTSPTSAYASTDRPKSPKLLRPNEFSLGTFNRTFDSNSLPSQFGRDQRPAPRQKSASVKPLANNNRKGRLTTNTNSASSLSDKREEALVNAVSKKLRGFQELRELMEGLAERHKKEEGELQSLMKKMLNEKSKHHQAADVRNRDLSSQGKGGGDGAILSSVEAQALLEERNRALEMLHLFRTEGNTVMQKMQQTLKHAHEQHDELVAQIDQLSLENARLRFVVREVQYHRDESPTRCSKEAQQSYPESEDQDEEQSDGDRPRVGEGQPERRQLALAKHTISKLDELLQEADAVITNLRCQNEELLKQNETLRNRERTALDRAGSSDAMDEYGADNVDDPRRPDETLPIYIDRLKLQLRSEQRYRLEAEELSHKLLVEHQKNVLLLEQRLLHRNTVGTPRGVTPLKHLSVSNFSTHRGSAVATPSSVANSTTHPSHPHVVEEVELSLPPSRGPSEKLNDASPEPKAVRCKGVAVCEFVPVEKLATDDDEIHQRNMDELRNIEEQLKEVVASLEDDDDDEDCGL